MTKSSLIKIGSETAKLSINITVSNICGAPQIFDNFEPAVDKTSLRLFLLYSSQCQCWLFCWLFRVGYDTHDQMS